MNGTSVPLCERRLDGRTYPALSYYNPITKGVSMEKRRIGVRAVVIKNNEVLAVKHKMSDGSESEYWALPGGGLDPHESIINGIHREMIEETGIAPDLGSLLFIQQFASTRQDSNEELELFFHVKNADDYESIDLTTTSHGSSEIARIAFINPRKERLYPKFLGELVLDDYVDNTHPVYIADYI
jgi:ADP-ribose pyrophosphatase YjhB (NUDIX family)